ncbi:MAG TPA: efflux RND transporter periplasmic adaptor subunit [Bryobacteraceae bacterium]|jgi:cobalt-zinc-cadmium efflux system membrane fusion protein|nr:efflux RND transporter periplasmic adaptor subunit [Bryobacteraceae bacterium]
MKRDHLIRTTIGLGICLSVCVATWGCGAKVKADAAAEIPPAAEVIPAANPDVFKVEHPEQFPLVAATAYEAGNSLNVTGVVTPDVSRNIPVISLASGRVLEIDARMGDTVAKGQRLMRVQSSDISSAFADYRTAMADDTLAKAQLARTKLLYENGAIAQKDVEVAQDAADKARIQVENTTERIRVMGADLNHPSAIIDIDAPASGVITEQNVTAAAGVKTLDNSPNLFTISDLSEVWVLCDVYENDLKDIHLGETADVRLNAFPDRVFQGRISNIGSALDPALRTAKVRIELKNPGMMRIGMFVTATFHVSGGAQGVHAQVPATAVLHLHDRDWVYEPAGGSSFRRVEVTGGKMLPSNMQEIVTGLTPGEQVISNALVLQNTAEQ